MKEIIRLMVVLTTVSALAGFSLAYVNEKTREPRAYQDRLKLLSSLNTVLPAHDNQPDKDAIEINGIRYYVSKAKGVVNGIAFETSSDKGYSGLIRVMVGITPSGEITSIEIMEQKETPGLGAKITEDGFRDQYKGKSLENARWKVKKDGGDFDQISGATISPRAVTNGIRSGLEAYGQYRQQIVGGAPGKVDPLDNAQLKGKKAGGSIDASSGATPLPGTAANAVRAGKQNKKQVPGGGNVVQ
jgi:Na+-translocating ferredoxin:NAD+ oxidoreductase subunit G